MELESARNAGLEKDIPQSINWRVQIGSFLYRNSLTHSLTHSLTNLATARHSEVRVAQDTHGPVGVPWPRRRLEDHSHRRCRRPTVVNVAPAPPTGAGAAGVAAGAPATGAVSAPRAGVFTALPRRASWLPPSHDEVLLQRDGRHFRQFLRRREQARVGSDEVTKTNAIR